MPNNRKTSTTQDSVDDFTSLISLTANTLSFAVESNACHFFDIYTYIICYSDGHKTQAIIFPCAYKMISMSKVDGARPISM